MYIGQPISSWQFFVLSGSKPSRAHMKLLNAPSEQTMKMIDGVFDFYLEHSPAVQYAVTLQTKLVINRDQYIGEQQMISISTRLQFLWPVPLPALMPSSKLGR